MMNNSIIITKKDQKSLVSIIGKIMPKLCWCLALASLLFTFGCKQTNNENKNRPVPTPQADVTITVKGDEGISLKSPNTFKVKRNSTWKDIKDNAKSKVTPKENKDIKEWRLNDAQGDVLVDTYKFEKDAIVFTISKEKDVPTPPTNSITITIEADEGYTFKDESSPCTIKVDKGALWSIVKTKADAKIELKDGFEKIGWKLGGKDGSYLEDAFVFNNDARVFATSKKKDEPVTPKITITVRGDENIVIASPDNFTVDKDSKWASLKPQAIALATPKENFEIASWRVGDEAGELLKDEKVFNEDATVFATSKRKVITYKVEHLQENIENDEYTTHETEEKRGEAGKNTSAEAKTYEGFLAQSFAQALIKEDGSTVIQIKYKRKEISLIIDLDGGRTTTELEDGKDGNKLLKGKYGAKVEVATPTQDDGEFEKWEPALPKAFPKDDDPTIYVAKWKMQVMRIRIKGDERIEVLEPSYIDFPLGTTKTFVDIKEDVKKKVKLKSEWDDGDYEIYDWRIGSYDGELIVDETPLTSGMRVYARSNYAQFEWFNFSGANSITGYKKSKPRGRIIIPAKTTEIKEEAFVSCTELTAVDFRGCSRLREIKFHAFSGCKAMEIVNLTGCSELTDINLSHTAITSIDLSTCPKIKRINFDYCKKLESANLSGCSELTNIDLSHTAITSIDLSSSPKLTSVNLSNTAITSIDLSPYPELTYVRLSETAITSIDLSSCPKIKRIFSEYCNELENINLTGCNELEYVNLTGTAITSIDLSTCPKIKTIDFIWCRKLENINITGCNELTDINLSDTAITSIDLSPCSKITRINFEDCKKLESIDLSKCTALKQIGEDYSYITPFSGCINAEVKLPTSITKIEIRAFGGYNDNYCKKVLVPDKTVKEWVKYSGYPEDRIEMY